MLYPIPNEEYYKLYDVTYNEFINYFYSKDELKQFIAKHYYTWEYFDDSLHFCKKLVNTFINKCTCDRNELSKFDDCIYNKRYMLYDNNNRIINVQDFLDDALAFYQTKLQNKKISYNYFSFLYNSNKARKYQFYDKMKNNYRYRIDPVPHTKKRRGGPTWSSPHTAGIIRMYANPEYKDFNRGSKHTGSSWWDDKYRDVQRSWKKQRKMRHQWQKI